MFVALTSVVVADGVCTVVAQACGSCCPPRFWQELKRSAVCVQTCCLATGQKSEIRKRVHPMERGKRYNGEQRGDDAATLCKRLQDCRRQKLNNHARQRNRDCGRRTGRMGGRGPGDTARSRSPVGVLYPNRSTVGVPIPPPETWGFKPKGPHKACVVAPYQYHSPRDHRKRGLGLRIPRPGDYAGAKKTGGGSKTHFSKNDPPPTEMPARFGPRDDPLCPPKCSQKA